MIHEAEPKSSTAKTQQNCNNNNNNKYPCIFFPNLRALLNVINIFIFINTFIWTANSLDHSVEINARIIYWVNHIRARHACAWLHPQCYLVWWTLVTWWILIVLSLTAHFYCLNGLRLAINIHKSSSLKCHSFNVDKLNLHHFWLPQN